MRAARRPRLRRHRTVALLLVVFGCLAVVGWSPPVPAVAAGCPSSGGGTLPPLAEPATDPEYVTFRGRGWGHGVGMSQYGARGAALLGCSAAQILTTYYPGASVTTRTPTTDVRVGLSLNRTAMSVRSGTRSLWWSCGSGCTMTQPANTTWTVTADSRGVRVHGRVAATVRVALGSGGDGRTVRLDGGVAYDHGVLELRHDGSRADVVLELDLEAYLYGIAEIPASWPTEALRTQAIAARSYAQRRLGSSYPGCPCHLLNTTASQVYHGGSYDSRWVAAVDSTRQQVATYGGAIIDAVYSSSHGGHSASSAFVWGSSHGYLQAVDDSRWEAASGNPLSRWSIAIDRDVLGSRLGVGRVVSVRVREPTGPGSPRRVGDPRYGYGGVTVVGTSGSRTLSGNSMRGVLGSFGQLASSLFTVSYPVEEPDASEPPTPTPDPDPEPTPTTEPVDTPTETATGGDGTGGDGTGGDGTGGHGTGDGSGGPSGSSTDTPTPGGTPTASEGSGASETPTDEPTDAPRGEETPTDEETDPVETPTSTRTTAPTASATPSEQGTNQPATTVVTEPPTASPEPGDGPEVISDQSMAVAGSGGTVLFEQQSSAGPPADPPAGTPEDEPSVEASDPPSPSALPPEDAPPSSGGALDFKQLYAQAHPLAPPGPAVDRGPQPPAPASAPTPMALEPFEEVVLPVDIPWWDQLPISRRSLVAAGAGLLGLALVAGRLARRRSPRTSMPVIGEP